jgi:hypothetical protein
MALAILVLRFKKGIDYGQRIDLLIVLQVFGVECRAAGLDGRSDNQRVIKVEAVMLGDVKGGLMSFSSHRKRLTTEEPDIIKELLDRIPAKRVPAPRDSDHFVKNLHTNSPTGKQEFLCNYTSRVISNSDVNENISIKKDITSGH